MQKTILIADDDRSIVGYLKPALEANGYRVITAYDGRTALDLIKLHNPDLALLDVMMPNMDGLTLGLEARESEELKNLPIIIMTGEPNIRKLMDKQGQSRIKAWFTKPVRIEGLLKKVRNILAQS